MKTLMGIARGVYRLLKYGAILLASLLRQRLARRRGRMAEADTVTAMPQPA